jgi:hypothetical protein
MNNECCGEHPEWTRILKPDLFAGRHSASRTVEMKPYISVKKLTPINEVQSSF